MQEFLTYYPATTAATSFNGSPILLNDDALVFFQYLVTGSDVAGTASVQASADGVTWTTFGSTQSVTSSSDSHFNVADCGAKYVRFVWAYTSGTGNISVACNVKAVGVTPLIAR
jgi:hypothetical protein